MYLRRYHSIMIFGKILVLVLANYYYSISTYLKVKFINRRSTTPDINSCVSVYYFTTYTYFNEMQISSPDTMYFFYSRDQQPLPKRK